MNPAYEAFVRKNNLQLNDYQRNVLFSKFSKDNSNINDLLIRSLELNGGCVAFARGLNMQARPGEGARLFVACEIVTHPTLTAYKVGSVMAALRMPSTSEYTAYLAGYKAHKGVPAFAIDPSDPFENFLSKHSIQLTLYQRRVDFQTYICADSDYQGTFINQLDIGNGWLKVASIINPDFSLDDAGMWVAITMSKPGLTALKVVQAAVTSELPCAKDFCKALSRFQLEQFPALPAKAVEAHPVETPAPHAVATQVILQQMDQLKQKAEKEKKLEEEIMRLRAAVAAAAVPAAAPAAGVGAIAIVEKKSPVEESSSNDCVVCLDREVNMVVIPCGHMGCTVCLEAIKNANKPCPVCRGPINATVKIFKN